MILRNSQFAAGGLLFDLGRYEESIRAFTTAANRARNTPEALEAYAQIASAYRRLGKPVEARLVIEQAKAMLNHVKNESELHAKHQLQPQAMGRSSGSARRHVKLHPSLSRTTVRRPDANHHSNS